MKHEQSPAIQVTVTTPDANEYRYTAWWSARPNVDGYQIVYEIRLNDELREATNTQGGGYCKETHAFEHFYHAVTGKYYSMGSPPQRILRDYRGDDGWIHCTLKDLVDTVHNA